MAAPTAVGSLTASPGTAAGTVDVSWVAPTNLGGFPLAAYWVEARRRGAPNLVEAPTLPVAAPTVGELYVAEPAVWSTGGTRERRWEYRLPGQTAATAGTPWAPLAWSGTATSATLTGLPAGVIHDVRVMAVNTNGDVGDPTIVQTVAGSGPLELSVSTTVDVAVTVRQDRFVPDPEPTEIVGTAPTPQFVEVLRRGGMMLTRYELLDQGDRVVYSSTASPGDEASLWGVTAGPMDWARGSTVQRRLNVSIPSPDLSLIPRAPGHALHWASGHRLRVWSGYRRHDFVDEMYPHATLVIDQAEATATSGVVMLTLSAVDVTRGVDVSFGDRGWNVKRGTPLMVEVGRLAEMLFPGVSIPAPSSPWDLPRMGFDGGSSVRRAFDQMLDAAGFEFVADEYGRPAILPIFETSIDSTDPVQWEYGDRDDTHPDALVVADASRVFARPSAPNGVRVEGGMTVKATVWDLDPWSMTYYDPALSPIPPRVHVIRNEAIRSNEQAAAVARAMLRRHGQGGDTVEFTSIPNPALRPSDVIRFGSAALGVDWGLFRVGRISRPSHPNALMRVTIHRSWNPSP